MATLPANRTKLNSAVSDQSQSITPASGKANREALIEAYDTIDEQWNRFSAFLAGYNRFIDGGFFTDTGLGNTYDGGTF